MPEKVEYLSCDLRLKSSTGSCQNTTTAFEDNVTQHKHTWNNNLDLEKSFQVSNPILSSPQAAERKQNFSRSIAEQTI